MKVIIILGALIACGAVVGVEAKKELAQRDALVAESQRVESKAAAADAAEIARGIKAYWDAKNGLAELENAEIALSNDNLEYQIAGLEGKPRSRSKIERDAAIVANDRMAIRLADDSDVPKLPPHAADARVEEHNRKYTRNKMVDTSDITREMEDFHSRAISIIKNSNDKLRAN